MKVAVGSDHAGYSLKLEIKELLLKLGYEVVDKGTDSESPVDYPDYAEKVAQAVLCKDAERGIMICGSGIGVSVAINKIPGIRGGLCHDTYSAHQGVEHDDMNVLLLGARVIGSALAFEIVTVFLKARFSNEPRHVKRLEKVMAIEKRFMKSKEKA